MGDYVKTNSAHTFEPRRIFPHVTKVVFLTLFSFLACGISVIHGLRLHAHESSYEFCRRRMSMLIALFAMVEIGARFAIRMENLTPHAIPIFFARSF